MKCTICGKEPVMNQLFDVMLEGQHVECTCCNCYADLKEFIKMLKDRYAKWDSMSDKEICEEMKYLREGGELK